MKPINVGLLGFGTVGRGTWDVLRRNEEEITRRAGRPIRVTWIATRRSTARATARAASPVSISPTILPWSCDIPTSTSSCELIGGTDAARTLVLNAIEHGKHVVTANKALLALHGNEIFAAAQKRA